MKKLFAPLHNNWSIWRLLAANAILFVSQSYITLVVMQYVTHTMEIKNYDDFQYGLVVLFVVYLVYNVIAYCTRNR